MNKIFLNKRGQVGETITWIVATVIIIFILGTTLFVAEFSLAKNKEVSQTTQVDLLVSKSFFSYLLTDEVYDKIKSPPEGLDDETGNLAKEIFEGLYEDEYTKDIWLGILFDFNLRSEDNEFFGKKPKTSIERKITTGTFLHVSERIKLNDEKKLELIMLKHGTIN